MHKAGGCQALGAPSKITLSLSSETVLEGRRDEMGIEATKKEMQIFNAIREQDKGLA